MNLRDEYIKSYIDDHRAIGLLRTLTWEGDDVAFAWAGKHEPATRSDDSELIELAKCNRVHYNFYRSLVARHVTSSSRALDIGCGSGQRTAMLSRYFGAVTGIDSDIMKCSMAPILQRCKNIDWVAGDFSLWAAERPDVFDHIFAVEVIEHINPDNHMDFIAAMLRHLQPGGTVLLTTPRDIPPERREPHIGLWDDRMAEALRAEFNATLEYFDRRRAENGDAFCGIEDATHYVMVVGAT